jgi:hypothetical protein
MPQSLVMLEKAASLLVPLLDELVFVGGAIVPLYIDDPAAEPSRTTLDVDCIIKAATRSEYYAFEERLRGIGFRQDMSPGAPICRYQAQGIIVDFMPLSPEPLGFSNAWYPKGFDRAVWHSLASTVQIRRMPWGEFIAVKLAAHFGRGGRDLRFSQDLEDVVTILDGTLDLKAAQEALRPDTKAYLSQAFSGLAGQVEFVELMAAVFERLAPAPMRRKRIFEFIDALAMA